MATVEERQAMLEGRMDAMGDLRTLIANLSDQMNRGFEQLRSEMGGLRTELRGEMTELRGHVGRETGALRADIADLRGDMGRRFDHLDRRITTVDTKHDRHFTWLVGLQMTMMLAVIGVLLAAYLR
jgi:hypothetical protein